MPTPTIAVVVCAYTEQRWDDLVACVAALRAQTVAPAELVLVIDHNDALLERSRAAFGDFAVVANQYDQGLSGARNTGIAQSSAEVIAFVDEDATPTPDWIETMATGFADPDVLGVGGPIEPLWLGRRPAWFPDEFLWVVGCTYRGMPTEPAPIRNLIGCNMSIRRSVLDAVGTFRIGRVGALSVGRENDETEICIRAGAHFPNGHFRYDPAVRVVNHRVPAGRSSAKYYVKRCYSEGISKARLSGMVGAQSGLSSERDYVTKTLPSGILHGLPLRAGGIVLGLGATGIGFVYAKVALRLGRLEA